MPNYISLTLLEYLDMEDIPRWASRHALFMVRPTARRLRNHRVSHLKGGRVERHCRKTYLHRPRDVDVRPADRRLVCAVCGLDALDK